MRTPVNEHAVASQGGYSRDQAISVYDAMGSKSMMCVNDADLARMVLARGGTPVLRMGAPHDDDLDARGIDPVEYADAMHGQLLQCESGISGAELKGIAHVGNEIGSSEPKRTIAWFTKLVQRSNFNRRPVCILNAAVFNPRPQLIAELPKLIPSLRENLQYGGGEIGFHEGTLITPEGQRIFTLDEALAAGSIGAYRWFIREFGIRARITEFAASQSPVLGWSTWMDEASYGNLVRESVRRVYAPDGVEIHPYTAFKWDRGEGFQYKDNPKLIQHFNVTNVTYPYKDYTMLNYLNHDWGDVINSSIINATARINVRTQPAVSGGLIGQVQNGEIVTRWTGTFNNGGYDWYRIEFKNQLAYIAKTAGLTFTDVNAPSGGLTPTQIMELESISDDLDDFIKEVSTVVNPPDTF